MFWERRRSANTDSLLVPLSTQMVRPARPLRSLMPEAVGTIRPPPSWNTTGAKLIALPPGASRLRVTVVLRESRSTSPLARAAKRSVVVSGRNCNLVASPSTAAATARQTSTSRPA